MADYYSPTVIQPPIPVAAMTPLERLLLENIFSAEPVGDDLYFYAEEMPAQIIYVDRGELEAALAASRDRTARIDVNVAVHLARAAADQDEIEIELDMTSDVDWEHIFQDIVRRAPMLRYVTAITSFECSKMRPDGFGGMAVLITADRILGKSTHDLIAEFLAETGLDA
jgi:hypothetical protein